MSAASAMSEAWKKLRSLEKSAKVFVFVIISFENEFSLTVNT
jgi:hypothetical protein